MKSEIQALLGSSASVDDAVVDAQVVDEQPLRKEVSADVASMCAAIFTAVAAGLKASREQRTVAARDRVLVPEIKVGDVIDAVESLRPRVLGAVASMCGAGADRLKTAQRTIGSKVERKP